MVTQVIQIYMDLDAAWPLGNKHGSTWLTGPQATTWPSLQHDIDSDTGCYRATDPDMALDSSSGLDNSMAPEGRTGQLDS